MKLTPLLTLLAASVAVPVSAQDQCPTAAVDANCTTCLGEGCVLTVGQCLSNCAIMDAPCWDMQYHENKTVDEVCLMAAESTADDEICGAEDLQDDCGACTSTLKSDGESTCQYYEMPGPGGFAYCGTGGCDMNGVCGSDTCQDGPDGPPPPQVDGPPPEVACAAVGSDADCAACLGAGCALAVGECLSSCSVIADAPCWSMEFYENESVEEVCSMFITQAADNGLCGNAAIDDCATCTSTFKSDGASTCEWYSVPEIVNGGYCGTGGCDMSGTCGSTECPVDPTDPPVDPTDAPGPGPCAGFSECEPCLNSKVECAWIADSCQPSCDMIMDVACYHPSTFPNMTGPEICAIASGANETMFDDPDQDGGPCNGFDLCEPCLNSRIECAWVGGGCEASCDVVADAACYHPAVFVNMTGPEICAKAVEAGDAVGPMDADAEDMETATDGEVNTGDATDGEVESEPVVVERGPAELESAATPRMVGAIAAMAVSLALFSLS